MSFAQSTALMVRQSKRYFIHQHQITTITPTAILDIGSHAKGGMRLTGSIDLTS